jgi:hypothetical protein
LLRPRLLAICCAGAIAASLLAACGSEGGDTSDAASESEEVARTVNSLFDATAEGDGEAACALLTRDAQLGFAATLAGEDEMALSASDEEAGTGCEDAVESRGEAAGRDDYRWTAEDVSFAPKDDPGNADAYAGCEFRGSVYLVRDGESWKVSLPACND